MASVNKKKKGVNSYMNDRGHKACGMHIKGMTFYTKQDRARGKKEVENFVKG